MTMSHKVKRFFEQVSFVFFSPRSSKKKWNWILPAFNMRDRGQELLYRRSYIININIYLVLKHSLGCKANYTGRNKSCWSPRLAKWSGNSDCLFIKGGVFCTSRFEDQKIHAKKKVKKKIHAEGRSNCDFFRKSEFLWEVLSFRSQQYYQAQYE